MNIALTENTGQQLPLASKKILLICPIFFGYEKSIERELQLLGGVVCHLADRPYRNPFLRALTNKFPSVATFLTEHFYYRRRIRKASVVVYDYVFVVNGQTCSSRLFHWLRESHGNAKFLLYFWDSVANRPESSKLAKCFDKVFTFDPIDSRNNGWVLRPLFFTRDYTLPKAVSTPVYGLSFIATAHTDRFQLSRDVFRQIEQEFKVFKYLYLQARWVYFVYKLLSQHMSNSSMADFNFQPLDKSKIREVFDNSLCILDIEHPNQTGLTIRTFEALGAGKKLITTNRSIKNYDFYNEKNILIIDRSCPQIPVQFLKAPYEPLPQGIYKSYSIRAWILSIFFDD